MYYKGINLVGTTLKWMSIKTQITMMTPIYAQYMLLYFCAHC